MDAISVFRGVLFFLVLPVSIAGALYLILDMVGALEGVRLSIRERELQVDRERIFNEREEIRNQQARLDLDIVHACESAFPVSRRLIKNGSLAPDAISLLHAKLDTQRTHAPVPNSIHYSVKSERAPTPEAVTQAEASFSVPTFREIYDAGGFPGGGKILLGYGPGRAASFGATEQVLLDHH